MKEKKGKRVVGRAKVRRHWFCSCDREKKRKNKEVERGHQSGFRSNVPECLSKKEKKKGRGGENVRNCQDDLSHSSRSSKLEKGGGKRNGEFVTQLLLLSDGRPVFYAPPKKKKRRKDGKRTPQSSLLRGEKKKGTSVPPLGKKREEEESGKRVEPDPGQDEAPELYR